MVAELVGDRFGIAGSRDDGVAGSKDFPGHQRAEAAGCACDEPRFHDQFLSILGPCPVVDEMNLTQIALMYKICYY
jgi:hypothetical protein